jgi:hypothetical protein
MAVATTPTAIATALVVGNMVGSGIFTLPAGLGLD